MDPDSDPETVTPTPTPVLSVPTPTSEKEEKEQTKTEEEEEKREKPTGVVLDRKRCIHCSLGFTSCAHVMYPCGHLCHMGCFIQRMRDLCQLRCGCELSTNEPLNWGIDKLCTDQASLRLGDSPTTPEPQRQPTEPTTTISTNPASMLSGVKESIFSFFGNAAASRHSKESLPQQDQLSTKELCKLISNGTLSSEELANQQCTFVYLVGRGVTMDHFLQGGSSLLDLKNHLLVETLGQMQEAGFAFKHLKLYRELTSPDQLLSFPDANAVTFQQFNVSADAVMGLGYSAVALSLLGLTVPNLFWGRGRSLTPDAILKSPLSYQDWRERLGLTPELAVRIGLTREACRRIGWPTSAVADREAEPLRAVRLPAAVHSFRQTRRKHTEDVYRVTPLTNLNYQ